VKNHIETCKSIAKKKKGKFETFRLKVEEALWPQGFSRKFKGTSLRKKRRGNGKFV